MNRLRDRWTLFDLLHAATRAGNGTTQLFAFTGGTAPRFYYNVEPKEPANYLAQILINTRRADDVEPLLVKLRRHHGRQPRRDTDQG